MKSNNYRYTVSERLHFYRLKAAQLEIALTFPEHSCVDRERLISDLEHCYRRITALSHLETVEVIIKMRKEIQRKQPKKGA